MGNVVGSNLFNLLVVMAMPGLLAPVREGKLLEPEEFNALPEHVRQHYKEGMERFGDELQALLRERIEPGAVEAETAGTRQETPKPAAPAATTRQPPARNVKPSTSNSTRGPKK